MVHPLVPVSRHATVRRSFRISRVLGPCCITGLPLHVAKIQRVCT
jgi:hypothetical protein